MSQIEHTKSRSAFSARENLSILTLQFHDNKKEALYRQATVLKCNEGNPEGVKTVKFKVLFFNFTYFLLFTCTRSFMKLSLLQFDIIAHAV